MLDTERLKTWLKDNGHSREWLAKEIGAQKRSLDNYFTSGQFPLWAELHIRRIMETPPTMKFTEAEFDRIERARTLTGYDNRTEFFIAAINNYVDQTLQTPPTPIKALPDPQAHTQRVADDETPYETKPKDLKGKQAG